MKMVTTFDDHAQSRSAAAVGSPQQSQVIPDRLTGFHGAAAALALVKIEDEDIKSPSWRLHGIWIVSGHRRRRRRCPPGWLGRPARWAGLSPVLTHPGGRRGWYPCHVIAAALAPRRGDRPRPARRPPPTPHDRPRLLFVGSHRRGCGGGPSFRSPLNFPENFPPKFDS